MVDPGAEEPFVLQSDLAEYCIRQVQARFLRADRQRITYAGGIVNLGCSCYAAVCLQMLLRSLPFQRLIMYRSDPLGIALQNYHHLMRISREPVAGPIHLLHMLGLDENHS